MELILLDQKVMQLYCYFMCCYFYAFFFKGDMIPAMVKKEDLSLWEEKVVEGHTYILHNFKILKNKTYIMHNWTFQGLRG